MNAGKVSEMLRRAVSILDEADVPADLRPEAFNAVWSSLVQVEELGGPPPAKPQPPKTEISGAGWDELAARLGVETGVLQEIYERHEDGSFTVHVPTSALAKTMSAGTRELALLTCAGRQAGVEEWTPAEVIRDVCQHYGKFDSANHAANMSEGEAYWKITGSGKEKRYKLRKAGWEETVNIVRKIAGE